MAKRTWEVVTITHRKTGLMIARSDDLPGLFVHGRDQSELDERVPLAIKAILEAKGEHVGEIVRCDDGDEALTGFDVPVAHYAPRVACDA